MFFTRRILQQQHDILIGTFFKYRINGKIALKNLIRFDITPFNKTAFEIFNIFIFLILHSQKQAFKLKCKRFTIPLIIL